MGLPASSGSMSKSDSPTLLQGTLDLLILHALQRGAAARLRDRADDPPALGRGPEGRGGLALSGAVSARARRRDSRALGRFREQPPREVLRDHRSRPEAAGGAARHLDAAVVRGRPRARAIGPLMRRFLLKLFRRRRLHDDLEAELAFHREMSRANGNAIPLGNVSRITEESLDLWRFSRHREPLARRDLRRADRGAKPRARRHRAAVVRPRHRRQRRRLFARRRAAAQSAERHRRVVAGLGASRRQQPRASRGARLPADGAASFRTSSATTSRCS